MTIIVYDGHSLAIDNAGVHEGIKVPLVKAFRCNDGSVITGVGNAAQIALMRDWYVNGAKSEEFPESQRQGNPWCELIVVDKDGLTRYEHTPSAVMHARHKCAFGVGKDIAYGALAMGATAEQAATIVTQYHPDCGHGVMTFIWSTDDKRTNKNLN